jgi:DNA-binding transcriptional LysR family regulator
VGAAERFQGLELRIVDGWAMNLAQRLEAGELDIVIGYRLESTEATEVTDLIEDRIVYIGPPGSVSHGAPPIPLREVLASNLIFFGEQSVGWRMLREATAAANLQWDNERHVDSIGIWRELICQGVGASVAPFSAIADEFRRGEVSVRQLEGKPLVTSVSVGVRRELRGEVWAQKLVAFLVELVNQAQARHAPYMRRIETADRTDDVRRIA